MQPNQLSVYVHPQVSLTLMNEKDSFLGTNGDWAMLDIASNTKIQNLSLRLTQHRLVLFHPTNKLIFNFEFHFDQLVRYEAKVSFKFQDAVLVN